MTGRSQGEAGRHSDGLLVVGAARSAGARPGIGAKLDAAPADSWSSTAREASLPAAAGGPWFVRQLGSPERECGQGANVNGEFACPGIGAKLAVTLTACWSSVLRGALVPAGAAGRVVLFVTSDKK